MGIGWRRRAEAASQARVAALEDRLGQRLPPDYRKFVLAQDGGEPSDNAFAIPGSQNESGVNDFLSLTEVERELDASVPEGFIPVAYAEGGNLVLVHVGDGRVFFWDHEMEDPQGLIELASSFDGFREALRPFDISEVQLKPGQVKSAWIDPDLLK